MNKLLKTTILTMLISVSASAMDIGLMKPSSDNFLIETFYNDYSRDLIQKRWNGDKFEGEQEEKRAIFRGTLFVTPTIGISAEVGTTSAEHGSGSAKVFGFGAQWSFYEKANFSITAFTKASYTMDIEYNSSYLVIEDAPDGFIEMREDLNREEKYWEYSAGIQVAYMIKLNDKLDLNFYTGVTASEIDSDCKENYTFYGNAVLNDKVYTLHEKLSYDNVDFEEDEPISSFLGFSANFKEYNAGCRVEAQFIGQTSYSIGIFKRL